MAVRERGPISRADARRLRHWESAYPDAFARSSQLRTPDATLSDDSAQNGNGSFNTMSLDSTGQVTPPDRRRKFVRGSIATIVVGGLVALGGMAYDKYGHTPEPVKAGPPVPTVPTTEVGPVFVSPPSTATPDTAPPATHAPHTTPPTTVARNERPIYGPPAPGQTEVPPVSPTPIPRIGGPTALPPVNQAPGPKPLKLG